MGDKNMLPHCLEALRMHLEQGFENPYGVTGRVAWEVLTSELGAADPGASAWSLVVDLSNNAVGEWQAGVGVGAETDAHIRLPLHIAEKFVADIHAADYRDPDIMAHLKFGGDLALVTHMAKALVAPGPNAKQRLDWATQRDVPAYNASHIERVHQPTEMEILDRIADGLPFVATGMSPDSGHSAWTLERLREHYGDVLLRVRSADSKETMAQFVDRVEAHLRGEVNEPLIEGFTKVYTEGITLPDAMRGAFMPHRFTLDDYVEPQIWLGAVPVNVPASSLHRDPLDGFLFQLMGRKKLVLYSPNQAPLLYPMKAWNNYQPCWVAPENPRLDLFPAFAQARALEVVLHPGELLLQPAGWFHAVYCLDSPTLSVSYFLRH